MKKLIGSLVAAIVFGLFAVPAHAQFKAGDWELTLNGGGTSSKSLQNTEASANVGVGFFLTNDFEAGIRQNVTYSSTFSGNTHLFVDYNFSLYNGKLEPFVGVSGGYDYGKGVTGFWTAGPEVGVRYFLTNDAFLYGSATYQFDVTSGLSSNNGGFQYGLGIGFRL